MHVVQGNVRHEYSDVYRVNARGWVNSFSLSGICTKIDWGRVGASFSAIGWNACAVDQCVQVQKCGRWGGVTVFYRACFQW